MNISYRSPGDALRVKDKPSSRGNTILKSIALVQEALGIHIISEQCNYPSSSWLNWFLQPFQNGRAQLHCDCSYRIVSFHAVRQWPPETDSDIAQDWPFVEVLDRPLALDAPASLSANQRHLPPPFLTPNPCDHNQTPNLLLTFSVFVCGVGSQDGNECGRMTNSLRYWSALKQHTPDSGHLHMDVDVTLTLPTVFTRIPSLPFVIFFIWFYFPDPAYICFTFCCQAPYLLNSLANFPPQ